MTVRQQYTVGLSYYCRTLAYTVIAVKRVSTVIHCHPLSATAIHCHLLSSTVIHCQPLASTVIHCHPLSSTVIHFHPLSSTFILLNSLSSTCIYFNMSWCGVATHQGRLLRVYCMTPGCTLVPQGQHDKLTKYILLDFPLSLLPPSLCA